MEKELLIEAQYWSEVLLIAEYRNWNRSLKFSYMQSAGTRPNPTKSRKYHPFSLEWCFRSAIINGFSYIIWYWITSKPIFRVAVSLNDLRCRWMCELCSRRKLKFNSRHALSDLFQSYSTQFFFYCNLSVTEVIKPRGNYCSYIKGVVPVDPGLDDLSYFLWL